MHHLFAERTNRALPEERDALGTLEKIEDPGSWNARAFDLLHFEFFRPSGHGTPYELIDQYNHTHHGENAEENRTSVAIVRGGLKIGAEARQAEVAKLLAGHQKEPGPGNRHHGIPHQADGGEGQFNLNEALPPVETIEGCRFPHLARNSFQRCIETEGHVPDLSGKNEQDGPHLDAQLTSGEKRGHSQHHTGKEAQYRNGLQNVEQGNHETFRSRTIGRNVAVGDSEEQAQDIGQRDTQQRVSGIHRKRAEAAADLDMRSEGAEPVVSDLHDAIEECQPGGKHDEVGQARHAGTRQDRPDANQWLENYSLRTRRDCTGVVVGGCGSPTRSGGGSRRGSLPKSKISAYRPQFMAVSNCRSTSSWLKCSSRMS